MTLAGNSEKQLPSLTKTLERILNRRQNFQANRGKQKSLNMSWDYFFYSTVEKCTLQMELSISSDYIYSKGKEKSLVIQYAQLQSIN